MNADLASALDDCIERLACGETLPACLARYPQHADELQPYLHAAARLEKGAQVRPSAAFKAHARAQLVAHMAAYPRPLKLRVHRHPLFPRLAFGLALGLIALTITTTALAQSALPGSVLYPWKLSSEQAWQIVAPDHPGADLAIADRRADEAVAASGNITAQRIALDGYKKVVSSLVKYTDPSIQQRIDTALKTDQDKLSSVGLSGFPSVQLTETPEMAAPASSTSPASPHTAGGVKNPDKGPTPTPVIKIPDIFGH
jgi:hypothetical protein